MLAVRDVHLHDQVNDREIVHGISFELTPGKAVGIVGESGSGKTLTCRAALGILPEHFAVSGGSIDIVGHDIAELSPAQWTELRGSTISAVFQDPASYLNPSMRVGTQIAEVISETSQYSTTIAAAVEQQSATTAEMSRNVAEAAGGADRIAGTVGDLAETAEATASGITEARAAAEELARMSSELRNVVSQFQLV